jgi:molecular chaperone GrpE
LGKDNFNEMEEENNEKLEEKDEELKENNEELKENEELDDNNVIEEICIEEQKEDYLALAKQIQADFDNFRKHSIEEVKRAKIDGQKSVIEVFLPCLDTFKEAKKSITDENVLKGVEMIEDKINDTLKSLGVEKMDAIGQIYNPHLHNVIAVMRNEEKENDIILDEYQAGYTFNGNVLRYAKVIVNKKED